MRILKTKNFQIAAKLVPVELAFCRFMQVPQPLESLLLQKDLRPPMGILDAGKRVELEVALVRRDVHEIGARALGELRPILLRVVDAVEAVFPYGAVDVRLQPGGAEFSSGIAIATGPGRPLAAILNAIEIVSASSSTSSTWVAHLVMGPRKAR